MTRLLLSVASHLFRLILWVVISMNAIHYMENGGKVDGEIDKPEALAGDGGQSVSESTSSSVWIDSSSWSVGRDWICVLALRSSSWLGP